MELYAKPPTGLELYTICKDNKLTAAISAKLLDNTVHVYLFDRSSFSFSVPEVKPKITFHIMSCGEVIKLGSNYYNVKEKLSGS